MERATKVITLTIVGSLVAYLGYQACSDRRPGATTATTRPAHSHGLWFWGRPYHGTSDSGATHSSGVHSSSSRGGFGGSFHSGGG